jgi:hypothetical protein
MINPRRIRFDDVPNSIPASYVRAWMATRPGWAIGGIASMGGQRSTVYAGL